VRHEEPDLEKALVLIEQPSHALARRELSLLWLPGDLVGPATFPERASRSRSDAASSRSLDVTLPAAPARANHS